MLQRGPVAFAAGGFDQIRELEGANELAASRIAKPRAAFRHRSHGVIGIPTTSSLAECRNVASKIGRSRCSYRRR
jgi:hypothetical protein